MEFLIAKLREFLNNFPQLIVSTKSSKFTKFGHNSMLLSYSSTESCYWKESWVCVPP